MRTDKELLILLRDFIIEHGMLSAGMCACIKNEFREHVRLSVEEKDKLTKYLYIHSPHAAGIKDYWFRMGDAAPRINWLNEQISKL